MLNKLPVIATNIGAIPDFLNNGKNGLMVEPGNVQQLKESLLKLLTSPELCKKFGESSYIHVKNNYTWNKVMENLLPEIKSSIANQLQVNKEKN